MTVSVSQFRVNFPEFNDQARYSQEGVTFWLAVAAKFVNPCRWLSTTDLGVQLVAAHMLVLEAQAQLQAALGNVPGLASGPVTSQSVDKVSESYDSAHVMEEGAGHWNLTNYGLRYIQLGRLFGAGGYVV